MYGAYTQILVPQLGTQKMDFGPVSRTYLAKSLVPSVERQGMC